jgi:hypothetical protein
MPVFHHHCVSHSLLPLPDAGSCPYPNTPHAAQIYRARAPPEASQAYPTKFKGARRLAQPRGGVWCTGLDATWEEAADGCGRYSCEGE